MKRSPGPKKESQGAAEGSLEGVTNLEIAPGKPEIHPESERSPGSTQKMQETLIPHLERNPAESHIPPKTALTGLNTTGIRIPTDAMFTLISVLTMHAMHKHLTYSADNVENAEK